MSRTKLLAMMTLSAGIALLSGGCGASYHARSMDLKGTLLVDPSILTPGTGDQMLYRYVNPKTVGRKYSKVMIDPVIVSKAAELDAGELENYQKLANNAFIYLTEELKKDYPIVTAPEPDTLRLQMAIIDADSSKPVRNLVSSVVPMSIGISSVQYAATGKMTGVGEISGEFRLSDASTGELLGAALDSRVGGEGDSGFFFEVSLKRCKDCGN